VAENATVPACEAIWLSSFVIMASGKVVC
jgi:hypothetical protein